MKKGSFTIKRFDGTFITVSGILSDSCLWGIYNRGENFKRNYYAVVHLPTGLGTTFVALSLPKACFLVNQIESTQWPVSWQTVKPEDLKLNIPILQNIMESLDSSYAAYLKEKAREKAEKEEKADHWEVPDSLGKPIYKVRVYTRQGPWILYRLPKDRRYEISLSNGLKAGTFQTLKDARTFLKALLNTKFSVSMSDIAQCSKQDEALKMFAPNREIFAALVEQHKDILI